jgi:hypothetical protein
MVLGMLRLAEASTDVCFGAVKKHCYTLKPPVKASEMNNIPIFKAA